MTYKVDDNITDLQIVCEALLDSKTRSTEELQKLCEDRELARTLEAQAKKRTFDEAHHRAVSRKSMKKKI